MSGARQNGGNGGGLAEYDAVVVGASLSGCATAMFLGRAGLRVALLEKSPDPRAYKRICSHLMQASAVPTLERLGLLDPIMAAGGLRSRNRAWARWGWIVAEPERAGLGVNLRRERLDPLVRDAAAMTPGVELLLGREVLRPSWREGAVGGVVARNREGGEEIYRGALVVGADGRGSPLAKAAAVPTKTHPHNRFAYASYFEGAEPPWAPDGTVWFLDPQFAAAFPTDDGLTMYVAMLTKDRLPAFRRDPMSALLSHIEALPEAPPIREGRPVGPMLGKIDMTNRASAPASPGLALVGDAALAIDPLFGVGCGWAFQSAEWLADSVTPALQGAEPLEQGLRRYARRHRHELRGHAFFIRDYATGRKLQAPERLSFAAAARDPEVAARVDAYATRQIRPQQMVRSVMPRAALVNLRHAVSRVGSGG
jgi:2-polyprenyl-6-methoxyphenol hydroxylase-like FAD-dependent oxidoreductase